MSSQVSCGLLLQKSFRLPRGPLKSGLHSHCARPHGNTNNAKIHGFNLSDSLCSDMMPFCEVESSFLF